MKFMKINKEQKLKGSIATYKQPDGVLIVDEKELAEKLASFEGLPESLSFLKASEVAALSRSYLEMRRKLAR